MISSHHKAPGCADDFEFNTERINSVLMAQFPVFIDGRFFQNDPIGSGKLSLQTSHPEIPFGIFPA